MGRPLKGVSPDMLYFAHPVNRDLIRFCFLTLFEAKIRLAIDKQNDVVDHTRIAYGEGQFFAGLQLPEGLIAAEHTDRPNYVAQIDFHRVLNFISNKLASCQVPLNQ